MIKRICSQFLRRSVCLSTNTLEPRFIHSSNSYFFWDSVEDDHEENLEGILSERGIDIPEEYSRDVPSFIHAIPVLTPSPCFRGGNVYFSSDDPVDRERLEIMRSAYKRNEYVGLFYTEEEIRDVERVKDISKIGVCGYVEDISKHFVDNYTVSITPVHPVEIIDQKFVSLRDKIEVKPYPVYLDDESDLELLRAYGQELEEILQEVFSDFDAFMSHQSVMMEILSELEDTDLLYYEKICDYTIQSVISMTSQPELEQKILEENNILSKMSIVVETTKGELETMRIRRKITEDLEDKFSEEQRRYYLNEQYKIIGEELGYTTNEKQVLREKFQSMLENKKPPEEVMEVIEEEMRKLTSLEPQSAEFNVCRTYLDWLCSVPWGVVRAENFDLGMAEDALNRNHYGLKDLKERILEFIAVSILKSRKKEREAEEEKEEEVEEYIVEEIEMSDIFEGAEEWWEDLDDILEDVATRLGGESEDFEEEWYEEEEEEEEEIEDEEEKEEKEEEKSPQKLRHHDGQGRILCFVGPPGTGKTSVGEAIAEALGRDLFRFSVGGMDDVSEIKGHRRTYIGAMPGKLVQVLKRAQCVNPVILIDEIDKMGNSYRGDPASALLEVLDPEQNHNFLDHYLDVPLDLSKVLFICTANLVETIPRPLLDRMEVLRLPGYVTEEKVEIAKRHLIPRLQEFTGLGEMDIRFSDDVLKEMVIGYCREAGVRSLEKELEKVFRKIAYMCIREEKENFKIETSEELFEYLGKPRFSGSDCYYGEDLPSGTAIGLAWSALGGSILYIETLAENLTQENEEKKDDEESNNSWSIQKGGNIVVTGMLQEVMSESVTVAFTFARTFLEEKGMGSNFFDGKKVHLHVPEGSTPKDGPSAGITIVTSLISLALDQPVNHLIGMTGEITLKGKVLPIGGVKEKIIASKRGGLKKIILPSENRADLEEMEDFLKQDLEFYFVEYYQDVFDVVFSGQ